MDVNCSDDRSGDDAAELIIALDLPDMNSVDRIICSLRGQVSYYKVGLEGLIRFGPEIVRRIQAEGCRVFLDLKFLDIPCTVARATDAARSQGVDMITVHGESQTIAAAVEAAGSESSLRIVAVTVLTSWTDQNVIESGYSGGVNQLFERRLRQAKCYGANGVVCSAFEAALASAFWRDDSPSGSAGLVVTPGIRLSSSSTPDDQVRKAEPGYAIASGATHLVVGRPITGAPNPEQVAHDYLDEMGRFRRPRGGVER